NINITNPSQNNTNTSNNNLDINFTRSDNVILSSCWYSNDTYLKNTTLTSCGNITNVVWSEGLHNVTIWVNDTGNNLNQSSISFTIDTTPPSISLVNISSYFNQSDGFPTPQVNGDYFGITTNNSDFRIIEDSPDFIYHVDKNGNNISEGFSVESSGAGDNRDVYSNGSDLWTVDGLDSFVYHFDGNGNNISDGFSTLSAGANNLQGITKIGNEFWIVDGTDSFVYHFNSAGTNQSDGFSITSAGSGSPTGITTNNSDFWITDSVDDFVYHFDGNGNNISDGFSPVAAGAATSFGITTNITSGTPRDFWIIDSPDSGKWVYHFTGFSTNTVAGNRSQNYIYIGASASDATGLSGLNISLYNSAGIVASAFSTSSSFSENFQNLADGVYYINVSANDSVGNINSTSLYSFELDTVAPSVTFSCTPASVTAGDVVTCSCSGTDATSGVQTTSYTVNPSTATTGTFTTSCLVTDYAGNIGNSSANYTVNAASSSSGGSSSSSSGGDSSSAGSSDEVSAEPISNVTTIISSITPGQPVIVPGLDSEKNFIKEIQIDVNKIAENAKINIVAYDAKPNEVSVEKEGMVYKYLRIETENINPNLKEAKITLQIGKEEISDETLKRNIALFKLDEAQGIWNELNTNYTSEDESYYYYEVQLSSFSYFAIGEKTFVQEIVSEITKSYDEASKNLLSLVVWWVVFGIIVTSLILVLVLISEFFIENRIVFYWVIIFVSATSLLFSVLFISTVVTQEINKDILAVAVWWIILAVIITAILLTGIVMMNFFSRENESRK
ncbi:MAG: PGF-pre-PGF domain-containing protein, partial [Nanoarchaeota archaeon]